MILRTSCKSCIFADNGCTLGKDALIHNNDQRVVGLCGHKKDLDWKNTVLQDYLPEQLPELSAGEYKTLTVLTAVDTTDCIGCRTKHLLTKILSIHQHPLVKHLIVSTYQKDKSHFQYIADYLEKHCNIPWTLDALLEEPIGLREQLDYSSRQARTYWIATLSESRRLNGGSLNAIQGKLDQIEENPIAFYFKEDDPVNLVYPNYAFDRMEGNNEMWWFDKVKTFDNWKDICHQIM